MSPTKTILLYKAVVLESFGAYIVYIVIIYIYNISGSRVQERERLDLPSNLGNNGGSQVKGTSGSFNQLAQRTALIHSPPKRTCIGFSPLIAHLGTSAS